MSNNLSARMSTFIIIMTQWTVRSSYMYKFNMQVGTDLGVFASNQFTQFHDLVIDTQSIPLLNCIMCRPTLTTAELPAATAGLFNVVCVDTWDRHLLSFNKSDRRGTRDNWRWHTVADGCRRRDITWRWRWRCYDNASCARRVCWSRQLWLEQQLEINTHEPLRFPEISQNIRPILSC